MKRSVKFANLVLKGGILFCFAALMYIYSVSNVRQPETILLYCLIFTFILFFLAVVLYACNDRTKVNISLLLLFTGIGIYTLEVALAIYGLIPVNVITQDLHHEAGKPVIPHDTRSKYEITMDLRSKGVDAYPYYISSANISTDGFKHNGRKIYPLGAVSKKTTVFCNEGDEPVIYESDEYGFRNPRGQYHVNGFDIALIGDSFAQGHCVKNGEDIAGRLRSSNIRVLNLGTSATGPLSGLAILSEYAKPFKPGYIFWLYYEGNDMPNLSGEKLSSTLMQYLDKDFSQDLVHNQDIVDAVLIADTEKAIADKKARGMEHRADISIKSRTSLKSFIDFLIHTTKLHNLRLKLGFHGNCVFNINPLFKDILVEANNRIETWGGKFYFVYLPSYDRYKYKKDLCVKRRFNQQREKVLSLANDLNIKTIDMTVIFDSRNDPLSLFHGHYNSLGYELVAQEIDNKMF
jgi:hypothetical protein